MMYCFDCEKHYDFNYLEEYQSHYFDCHPEKVPPDFERSVTTPQERVERRLAAHIVR